LKPGISLRDLVAAYTEDELAQHIDNTLLKPDATPELLNKYIEDTKKYRFACLVLSPYHALQVLRQGDPGVRICSVVGFPAGYSPLRVKVSEAEELIAAGVKEIDMVMNIQAFERGDYDYVTTEIAQIVDLAKSFGVTVKVIIEAPMLTDIEKIRAVELAIDAGAHYVKTSTGMLGYTTSLHDVEVLVRAAMGRIKVKAAGGIRHAVEALTMLAIGADRIGTSTAVQIIEEFKMLKKLYT